MPGTILENLGPPDLVEAALTRDQVGFGRFWGDSLILLVRGPYVDVDFTAGLRGLVQPEGIGAPLKPAIRSLEFHTAFHQGPLEAASSAPESAPEQEKLKMCLAEDAYLAVPLRKRADADALHMDRVSIGRARNKDIVLRDVSVSKFHGWFEADDFGAFYFSDAGSKNSTRVNGRPLVSRERTRLEPGDSIRFGSIEGVLCSPHALWMVVQAARSG